jgi:thiamine biosynthesis lipoprotein
MAPYAIGDWSAPAMGGRLSVAVATDETYVEPAARAAERVGRRVTAWANRLTRFSESSDLARLNADSATTARVRPTLGSALNWAYDACAHSGGVVDVTLLDARLAAENGSRAAAAVRTAAPTTPSDRAWSLRCVGRHVEVQRRAGVRFDLDGVAKGWLADRASWLLSDWPGAFVDADGDIALAAVGDVEWLIDVVDPRADDVQPLTTLRFRGTYGGRRTAGVATSGTSVHRWQHADGDSDHHLIDPRTRQSARTDVEQATVVAPTAREAEVIAKAAVILGSRDGARFLARSAAHAAVLLLDSGALVTTPGTELWLA